MRVPVLDVAVPGSLLFTAFMTILLVASAVMFRRGRRRHSTRR